MINWKPPKLFPFLLVLVAAVTMLVIMKLKASNLVTFPLLLFMSAQLCLVFGLLEIAFTSLGKYQSKQDTYNALSRAISAFGMTICFMLLIGAYEAARH